MIVDGVFEVLRALFVMWFTESLFWKLKSYLEKRWGFSGSRSCVHFVAGRKSILKVESILLESHWEVVYFRPLLIAISEDKYLKSDDVLVHDFWVQIMRIVDLWRKCYIVKTVNWRSRWDHFYGKSAVSELMNSPQVGSCTIS